MEEVVTQERGVNAVLMKAWLEQNHKSQIGSICEKLSDPARDMLTSPESNQWYPVELMKEIYTAVFEVLDPENPRILADYGYFAAERSASGLLKYLMKLIDMNTVIKRMRTFWKHYHKGGRITAGELSEVEGRKQRVISIHGYDAGAPACMVQEGYFAAIANRAGARNFDIQKKTCIHSGDAVCSWKISWI